jgi:DNA-binding MarR family transcriptional regulator
VVLRYPGPEGCRPGELAERSGTSRQTVSYLLGQLETLGYLERREDPSDRRSRRVRLTRRGHSAVGAIRAAVAEVEEDWHQLLGSDDLEQFRRLLARLGSSLD